MATKQLTRWKWSLLLGAAIVLTGCADPAEKAAAAADVEVRAALDEVKAIEDPWEAFKRLDSLTNAAMTKNDTCRAGWAPSRDTCKEVPALDASKKERARLLALAIEKNQAKALSYLHKGEGFASSNVCGDACKSLRRDTLDKVFAYADKANGKPEDVDFLMLAAKFVGDGNKVTMDTSRAVGYYAKAWAAGEPTAANAAALLFYRINDLRNAYLWSLRCTGECQRDSNIELLPLQADLSPEAAKQVQRLAAKLSVVEMFTSGG